MFFNCIIVGSKYISAYLAHAPYQNVHGTTFCQLIRHRFELHQRVEKCHVCEQFYLIPEGKLRRNYYFFHLTILRAVLRSNSFKEIFYLITWKNSLEPWLSPPSAWIGSTIIPATGIPILAWFSICSSTVAKHLSSSAWFSLTNSSKGYLYLGKSEKNSIF